MNLATIELMHDQVCTIYRAATGSDLNAVEQQLLSSEQPPAESDVELSFAALNALARRHPVIGARVPPFAFTPFVDLIDVGTELVAEVVAPGVDPADVQVEATEQELTVSGLRRGGSVSNSRMYLHAEIPRGPFRRVIGLPCAVDPQPNVEIRNGLIVVRLRKR